MQRPVTYPTSRSRRWSRVRRQARHRVSDGEMVVGGVLTATYRVVIHGCSYGTIRPGSDSVPDSSTTLVHDRPAGPRLNRQNPARFDGPAVEVRTDRTGPCPRTCVEAPATSSRSGRGERKLHGSEMRKDSCRAGVRSVGEGGLEPPHPFEY